MIDHQESMLFEGASVKVTTACLIVDNALSYKLSDLTSAEMGQRDTLPANLLGLVIIAGFILLCTGLSGLVGWPDDPPFYHITYLPLATAWKLLLGGIALGSVSLILLALVHRIAARYLEVISKTAAEQDDQAAE